MNSKDFIEEINEALRNKGVHIDDIYDLVNSKISYPEVIPILVEMIQKGMPNDKVKEGVIRALSTKEAKGIAGEVLLEEFYRIPEEMENLKWVIGNAINVIATRQDVDGILKIVKDKKNKKSREMFVLALKKFKIPQVEMVLIDLLDDREVAAFAINSLGFLKSKKAKTKIYQLLHSEDGDSASYLIKKEAEIALKRIMKE